MQPEQEPEIETLQSRVQELEQQVALESSRNLFLRILTGDSG